MPKTGAKRRSLERTQRVNRVRPTVPSLESQARNILAAMVEEVTDFAEAGLMLPDPAAGMVLPEAIVAAPEADLTADAQPIDDLATGDLVTVAQNGASLEVDGSKYTSDELELLAENVAEEAHLKVNNSGAFTAKELAAIARSGPGQVIFA